MDFNNNTNSSTIFPDSQQTFFAEILSNVAKYSTSIVASLLILNTVTEILTLLGNLIVILTVAAYRELWVPTNILVASLAVADFISGFILHTINGIGLFNAVGK